MSFQYGCLAVTWSEFDNLLICVSSFCFLKVLFWLKQWDPCVFGTDIKSTTEDVLSSLRRYTSVAQHQKKSSINYFGKNGEPWSGRENFKQYNKLEQESSALKANQELLNKNHKGTGPLEQKVSCMIFFKTTFVL